MQCELSFVILWNSKNLWTEFEYNLALKCAIIKCNSETGRKKKHKLFHRKRSSHSITISLDPEKILPFYYTENEIR